MAADIAGVCVTKLAKAKLGADGSFEDPTGLRLFLNRVTQATARENEQAAATEGVLELDTNNANASDDDESTFAEPRSDVQRAVNMARDLRNYCLKVQVFEK